MQATTERRPGQLRTRSNPTDGIVAAKQILSFWRYEPTASSEQGGTSGASTPLSDGNLLRSLRARSAWQWTKAFLVKKDLKPGTGYPAIEAALAANNKYGQNLRVALQEFYESIRFAGRKYVQIFEIPSNISDVLKPILNEAQVQPSKFSEFFPYVLPDTALGSAPPTITLCEVTKSASGDYTLVYCSRKDYTERDIFENAAATELGKLAPALVGYGKIVGLKTRSFQAFDMVVIRPGLRRLEILVDMPLGHIQDFDKIEQATNVLRAVELHLPQLAQHLAGKFPDNIFAAIDEIYKNVDGGQLQEIRLRTSTGLLDTLKTTVDADDLRINKYHTESAKAVNNEVEIYDITTRFQLALPPSAVTARLKSSVRTLSAHAESRALRGFELLDCMSPHDILRSVNKVQSFSS
jgi:hypothetical protein